MIDVERRNALASMHSAAHILSATANERWGAITVGNQLGVTESRMDLSSKIEMSLMRIYCRTMRIIG